MNKGSGFRVGTPSGIFVWEFFHVAVSAAQSSGRKLRKTPNNWLKIILCFFLVFSAGQVLAQEAEEKKEDEGDDLLKLLNELESVKEVEEELAPGEAEDAGTGAEVKTKRPPAVIVKDISETMDKVSDELEADKSDSKKIVEGQRKIVGLIDEILDMVSKSPPPPQAGAGQKNQSKKNTPKSFTIIPRPGGAGAGGGGGGGNPGDPDTSETRGKETGDQWGNLPERVREDILQIFQEDIPLLYKDLLRLYFKNIDRE